MSINIYNKETKTWEKKTSLLASAISIADAEGSFEPGVSNVEDALKELKKEAGGIKKDVKYIYENGTIGGGGGGGGTTPSVTLTGSPNIICRTDEKITIRYIFTSPNKGRGVLSAVLVNDGTGEKKEFTKVIKQGNNELVIDPLSSGTYTVTMYVTDQEGDGWISNIVTSYITSGTLEISSTSPTSRDVDYNTPVNLNVTISSIIKDKDIDLVFEHTYLPPDDPGRFVTYKRKAGVHTFTIPGFTTIGGHEIIVKASVEDMESNTLRFNYVVVDSESVVITSTFDDSVVRSIDKNFTVPYRISMKDVSYFKTEIYINNLTDEPTTTIESKKGLNEIQIDVKNLGVGNHTLKFRARPNIDGEPVWSDFIIFSLRISEVDFELKESVTDNLIAKFEASGYNSGDFSGIWHDKSGNNVSCKLHYMNNVTNGWVRNNEGVVDALSFSSKSYAEIDLAPFKQDLSNGFTFEFRYKYSNTGDSSSCLIDIMDKSVDLNQNTNDITGILITEKMARIVAKSGERLDTTVEEDIFNTVTFSFERDLSVSEDSDKLGDMFMYVNGVIAGHFLIPKSSGFVTASKITLGAYKTLSGEMIRNSVGGIQAIRLYKRSLTPLEVLTNYMSDLNVEEQKAIAEVNDFDNDGGYIPEMRINTKGAGIDSITSSRPTTASVMYRDPSGKVGVNFDKDFCEIYQQGTTSSDYPVKNFTLILKENDGLPTTDYTPKPEEWVPDNRYTLKANFMDSSHSNNVGCAKFIHALYKEGPDKLDLITPGQEGDDRVRACIDGFPIKIYVDNIYQGIYTFNIDRYSHANYGLLRDGIKNNAISYEISDNNGPGSGSNFDADPTDPKYWLNVRGDFKLRYYKGQIAGVGVGELQEYDEHGNVVLGPETRHEELSTLIKFIKTNGTDGGDAGSDFASYFSRYMDKTHSLYYLIVQQVFGLVDNLAKNMVITYFKDTPGEGGVTNKVFYPLFYDLDSMLGLTNSGRLGYDADLDFEKNKMQVLYNSDGSYQRDGNGNIRYKAIGDVYNGSQSTLWTKFRECFADDIAKKYRQLRTSGWLTVEKIMEYYYDEVSKKIGHLEYNVDARKKYLNKADDNGENLDYSYACKGSRIEFTKNWLKKRFTYLDSLYDYQSTGANGAPIGHFDTKINLRTNLKGKVDFSFYVNSPMWIQATFPAINESGTSNGRTYMKKYCSEGTEAIFEAYISESDNSTDGTSIVVNFAPYITKFNNVKNLKLSEARIGDASSLTELDLSGTEGLTTLALNKNTGLRKLNVNGCIDLGLGMSTIDLSNCKYLKDVDIRNTALEGINFSSGGSLENFYCSGSKITDITFNSQEYIENLELQGCDRLSTITVDTCKRLKSLTIPDAPLTSLYVGNCEALTELTVSQTAYLSSVDIQLCPNLSKVIMSSLKSETFRTLNLVSCSGLKYLDITGCTYLNYIRFNTSFRNLETLLASSTGLKGFIFGLGSPTEDVLNFDGFNNVERVNFKDCKELTRIANLTCGHISRMSGNLFNGCEKLISLTGTLTFAGALDYMFSGCTVLATFPTVVMGEVTGISQAFSNCKALDYNTLVRILNALTGTVTSNWCAFAGCTGIVQSGGISSTLFQNNGKWTTLNQTFSGCSNFKGAIAPGALSHFRNLVSFYYPFSGCSFTLTQDSLNKFFLNCGNATLTTIESPFSGVSFDRLPTKEFFDGHTAITTIYKLFRDKSSMINAPDASSGYFINEDFFQPLANSLLYTTDIFYNCQGLVGKIPENLINRLTKCRNFVYFFYNCKSLVSPESIDNINHYIINSDFFPRTNKGAVNENSDIQQLQGFFYNCTGLSGGIHTELFSKMTKVTNMERLFSNCTGLRSVAEGEDSIPNSMFEGKKSLTNISYCFSGCSNPGFAPILTSDTFKDNSGLTSISHLFNGVIGLSRQLPNGLFASCTNISSAAGVFKDCVNLSSDIPADIFQGMKDRITDLSYFFSNCRSIYGSLPRTLFRGCVQLKNISYFLNMPDDGKYTRKIGTDRPSSDWEEDGTLYLLDPDFFIDCLYLENMKWFLGCCWTFGGKIPPRLFMMNTRLSDMSFAFYGVGRSSEHSLEVAFDGTFLSNSRKIKDFSWTFRNLAGKISITKDFLSTSIDDAGARVFTNMFLGNSGMTGEAPLWDTKFLSSTAYSGCFQGCTSLSNRHEIPKTWGGDK